jgi:hypothetical protein
MFLLGTAGLILKWIVLPVFYKNVFSFPLFGERPRRRLVRQYDAPFVKGGLHESSLVRKAGTRAGGSHRRRYAGPGSGPWGTSHPHRRLGNQPRRHQETSRVDQYLRLINRDSADFRFTIDIYLCTFGSLARRLRPLTSRRTQAKIGEPDFPKIPFHARRFHADAPRKDRHDTGRAVENITGKRNPCLR